MPAAMTRTIRIPAGYSIDPYLRNLPPGPADILLEAGAYYTGGAAGFPDYSMLQSGWRLKGAGWNQTKLFIDGMQYLPNGAHQFEGLTAGSRSGACDRVAVEDLSIDFVQNSRRSGLGLIGLHVWSDSATVKGVRIAGISGSRLLGGGQREGFGLLVNRAGKSGLVGGYDIKDVQVTVEDPNDEGTENYVTGIFLGAKRLGPVLVGSAAAGLHVSNAGSRRAHAAFAFSDGFEVLGASNAGRFARAIFNDTGGSFKSAVRGSTLTAEGVLVECRGGAEDAWFDFMVRDSNLTLESKVAGQYGAVLVLVDDAPKGEGKPRCGFSSVRIDSCRLNVRLPKGVPAYAGSADGRYISGCGIFKTPGAAGLRAPVLAGGAAADSFIVK